MTKQGFSELAGKKVSNLLPTLSLSKHYTTPLFQISPPPYQNPTPSSSRANLSSTKTPFSVFPKSGFAKIGHASQSLIIRNLKALFKGKSKRDRAFCGESEPLPRLMGRRFEGDQPTHRLDSYSEVKMPIKVSRDKGLMVWIQIRGWRRKSPENAVLMRVGSTKGWRNLWLYLYITKVYGIITNLSIL